MRADDLSKTPLIVEQLDSDDPAVRLIAIAALEKPITFRNGPFGLR